MVTFKDYLESNNVLCDYVSLIDDYTTAEKRFFAFLANQSLPTTTNNRTLIVNNRSLFLKLLNDECAKIRQSIIDQYSLIHDNNIRNLDFAYNNMIASSKSRFEEAKHKAQLEYNIAIRNAELKYKDDIAKCSYDYSFFVEPLTKEYTELVNIQRMNLEIEKKWINKTIRPHIIKDVNSRGQISLVPIDKQEATP